jgi:hypothetical protein
MTFVYAAALAALVLVVAPVLAHLLRRRRADPKDFPPAALVPPSSPAARHKSSLDDRLLFAIRVLALAAIAFLGASPFVRCSRFALGRPTGASVAIVVVVDDSMSMRSTGPKGVRFDQARRAAQDLLTSAREGDAIGLVLAGKPARIALASTTDLSAASSTVKELHVSDRATDLDAALALARSMLRDLPHTDKRIVLLSDLCDGRPEAPAIGENEDFSLWAPSDGLNDPAQNCAIIRAERKGAQVLSRVACSGQDAAKGRHLELVSGTSKLAQVALPDSAESFRIFDLSLPIAEADAKPDSVRLTGPDDSIAIDDALSISRVLETFSIGVVADKTTTSVVTGGAPPVEQALAALDTGASLRPLATLPDTPEDLSPYSLLIIDDPPGLTPETRAAMKQWAERGGVGLLALGPRAASAPLGSSFEPFLQGVVRWETTKSDGIDPRSSAFFGPNDKSMMNLGAKGRARLDFDNQRDFDILVKWGDGAPWLAKSKQNSASLFVLTMPLNAELSDFPFRPGFLSLLDNLIELARGQGGSKRIEVGSTWLFPNAKKVEAHHSSGAVRADSVGGTTRVSPEYFGRYDLRVDGTVETRIVTIPEREVDLRRRSVTSKALDPEHGSSKSSIDISPQIALLLLGLLCAEGIVRVVTTLRDRKQSHS